MDESSLIRERVEHVNATGQPLRPAYNEVKGWLHWIVVIVVFGVMVGISNLILYDHFTNQIEALIGVCTK